MKARIIEIDNRPHKGALQLVDVVDGRVLYHVDAWVHWPAAREKAVETLRHYANVVKITVEDA